MVVLGTAGVVGSIRTHGGDGNGGVGRSGTRAELRGAVQSDGEERKFATASIECGIGGSGGDVEIYWK